MDSTTKDKLRLRFLSMCKNVVRDSVFEWWGDNWCLTISDHFRDGDLWVRLNAYKNGEMVLERWTKYESHEAELDFIKNLNF